MKTEVRYAALFLLVFLFYPTSDLSAEGNCQLLLDAEKGRQYTDCYDVWYDSENLLAVQSFQNYESLRLLATASETLRYEQIHLPANTDSINLGFNDDTVWIAFQVKNSTDQELLRFLSLKNRILQSIDMYAINNAGFFELSIRNGSIINYNRPEETPFHVSSITGNIEQMFEGYWPSLPVFIEGNEEVLLIMRIESETVKRISTTLYSSQVLHRSRIQTVWKQGIFYSMHILAVLFNFLAFFILKDRNFLSMTLFLLFYTIFSFSMDGIIFIGGPNFLPNLYQHLGFLAYPLSFLSASYYLYRFSHPDSLIKKGYLVCIFFSFLLFLHYMIDLKSAILTGYIAPLIIFPFFIIGTGFSWYMGQKHMMYLFIAFIIPGFNWLFLFIAGHLGLTAMIMDIHTVRLFSLPSVLLFTFSVVHIFKTREEQYQANLESEITLRTEQLAHEISLALESNKYKEELIRIVSHDVRSPISAIKTNLPLLINASINDEQKEYLLLNMKDTLDRLLSMTEDLLQKNANSDSHKKSIGWTYLRELCAQSINQFQLISANKGIHIENRVEKNVVAWIDPVLFKHLLTNLLENSLKFCRKDDTVSIMAFPKKSTLIVEDTGPGINPQFRENLFNPRVQTTNTGSAGEKGSGLGLLIAREIARSHDCSIVFEASKSGGAAFSIIFPKENLTRDTNLHDSMKA